MSKKVDKKISINDKIVDIVSNNIVWVFLVFILIVIILPRLFIGTAKIGIFDNFKPNEIGDAIGGMTAPIIGSFSAFLVYIAFREQVIANKILKEENTHNTINRYINLIEYIKQDTLSISYQPQTKENTIIGINAIEHIFTLLNIIDFHRANDFLKNNYEDIIRIYLLSINILDAIDKLDVNTNEKIFLINKLSFLKSKIPNNIEINDNYIKGTLGEKLFETSKFIRDSLHRTLVEFNNKYDTIYKQYISRIISDIPNLN